MRGSISEVMALVVVASMALPGSGQIPAAQTSPAAISKPAPLARLPYIAEFKMLRTQTLANGAAITHETTVVTARDSQGRRMTATTIVPTSAAQRATTHFQVFDPVDHVTFNWSFPGREATVMAIPFSGAAFQGCGAMSAGISSASAKTTVEDMGTMAILGVEAQGRRTTTTIPLHPIGKHKKHKQQERMDELVSTAELWRAIAPGLNGLVVREVNVDMPPVKSSKELVKFSQGEPDAVVFRPPTGYEIVNREVNVNPCAIFEAMEPSAAPNLVLPRSPEK
jgi:hypothetical protein